MKDKDKVLAKKLAREGKTISNIYRDDLSEYEYWEIYDVVYEDGGKSMLGVKRAITNRLNTLSETSKKNDRQYIIDETSELIWHLYDSLKSNQEKLKSIRQILNK